MFGLLSCSEPVCGSDSQNSVGSFRSANVSPSRPGATTYGSLVTQCNADVGKLHSKQHLCLFAN